MQAPVQPATPLPLDLKLRCPDCGALIRAPTDAAVLACPGCDSYFANPQQLRRGRRACWGIVAEQARIAELVTTWTGGWRPWPRPNGNAPPCLRCSSSPWAARLYADARRRGKHHPHAVRILARAWLRVIWACWHTNTIYDPAKHGAEKRLAA